MKREVLIITAVLAGVFILALIFAFSFGNFNKKITGNPVQPTQFDVSKLGGDKNWTSCNKKDNEIVAKYKYQFLWTTKTKTLTYTDKCLNDNQLRVYSCNGKNLYYTNFNCENGCEDNICVTKIQRDGLIIINKFSNGVDYSKEIAQNRNWGFIELESNDIDYIKNMIKSFHDENNNEFLLIIGNFSEIPIKEAENERFRFENYITDPQLYGDINDDGYVDLSIGRIPFSESNLLNKYFTNLTISGEDIYVENYPFGDNKGNLPYDEFTTKEYLNSFCLKKELPQVQPFRFKEINQLKEDYKNASILVLNSHGGYNYFSVTNEEELKNKSMTTVGINFLCDSQEENCFMNRPIILHYSCLNARGLGIEMIKRGASAFSGNYNTAGYFPQGFLPELSTGKPIGTVVKDQINRKLSHNLVYNKISYNISENSNINIIDQDIKMSDNDGTILYGDPLLRLNLTRQENSKDITITKNPKYNIMTVKINENPEFILDPEYGTDYYGILCYNSEYVDSLFFTSKSNWEKNSNSAHVGTLIIPIINNSIKEIDSIAVKGKSENQYEDMYNNIVNYYLFKAKDKQYLYLDFMGNSVVSSDRNFEIEIYYH